MKKLAELFSPAEPLIANSLHYPLIRPSASFSPKGEKRRALQKIITDLANRLIRRDRHAV